MIAEEFDINWFRLETSTTSAPATGIMINTDGIKKYEAQSTFRFTDKTASKESRLSNLILSTGEKNEEQPENATYKEYALNPIFDKDHLNYEVTLMEYMDTMDLKAILEDDKATMKIKVPKKEEDGTTIAYEEKELTNDTPIPIVLNKLGEPDTVITITVTAENGKSTNEYVLTIKRPYGTITGNITTYNTDKIHIATVKIYKAEEIEWEDYYECYNNVYTKADIPEPITFTTSEQDGTFSIKVVPGKYDIMVDKKCHFDYIIKNNEVAENEIKDKGTINLVPGDINKDGKINAKDFNIVKMYFGQEYLEADIDENGTTNAPDFNAVKMYFGQDMPIY